MVTLLQLLFLPDHSTTLLSEISLRQANFLILLPLTVLICLAATGLAFSAFRKLRVQHARAEELAGNLHRVREENRRRLLFLNAISHDLRTPLNGIALQTHVIESAMALKDPATLSAAVGEIRSSYVLAAEILDALLKYAHTDIDPTVIAPVNLRTLLTQAADPFRAAAAEKSLTFSLSMPADITFPTDSGKLQRLLANLLDNAIKFTTHGSISVRASVEDDITTVPTPGADTPAAAGNRLPLKSSPTKKSVLLEIQDTGCGIPLEDQHRLFNEFYQANNPSRDARLGLGLGLVIARRLAQQLGGNLTCDSTPGKGTIFSVRLPLNPSQSPCKPTAPA